METRLKNLDGNGCNDSPCNCIVFFSVLLHVSFNRLQLIFREGVRVGSTQETPLLRENQYLADGLCFHFKYMRQGPS